MKFSTPILFIIYNRPDTTFKVFQAIRALQPSHLYIAADGPSPGNAEKCAEARRIVDMVDWPCDLKLRFNQQNEGCKHGVSKAISWFFENEEMGIILEDDCLPDPSFFGFCEQMLTTYKDDPAVGHIGGVNFQKNKKRGSGSYYFSKYPHIWGWATWRRAWQLYDPDMHQYRFPESLRIIAGHACCESERFYWWDKFECVVKGKCNTWDYQWLYCLWLHGLKSITPNVNLVTNIGFDGRGTHKPVFSPWFANLPTGTLEEIVHPDSLEIEAIADQFTYRDVFRRFFLSNVLLGLAFYIKKTINEIHPQKTYAKIFPKSAVQ